MECAREEVLDDDDDDADDDEEEEEELAFEMGGLVRTVNDGAFGLSEEELDVGSRLRSKVIR